MDPNGHTGPAHLSVVTSVAVPFAVDRPFWTARLRDTGAAGNPVDGSSLRPAALARGIQFAERAGVRARARALGEAMAKEDGLATAVPLIEALTSH